MAVIKIPSKNIYSVSGDSILLKNKIANAQINSNTFSAENGEVSEKTASIVFYTTSSYNSSIYFYMGNDDRVNEFIFTRKKDSSGVGIATGTIVFDTKKLSILKTRDGKLISHSLKIIQKFELFNVSSQSSQTKAVTITEQVPTVAYIDDKKIAITYSITSDFETGVIDTYLMSADFSLVGTYYETNEELKSYSVDETSENIFSLLTNELENTQNTYKGENFTDFKLFTVVERYKNGKEAITLKCSASNYYDVDGNLVICPTVRGYPMTFSKYDIVEPYVFTVNGEVPLSSKMNGDPKQFEVIGIDFSYSGVFWQELTLQEYVE